MNRSDSETVVNLITSDVYYIKFKWAICLSHSFILYNIYRNYVIQSDYDSFSHYIFNYNISTFDLLHHSKNHWRIYDASTIFRGDKMLELTCVLIRTTYVQPRFEIDDWALTQSMDKINMVHPRKISLAEMWGSIRFFISNFFLFLISTISRTLDLELS